MHKLTSKLELPWGIAGQVELFEGDRLCALVEKNISLEELKSDEERLMRAVVAHDRAICELFRQTPILPLRFGTVFRSSSALLEHISSCESEYLQKLARLAGLAEYSLRAIPLQAPASSPVQSKGKEYLLAKKQRYQARQNFQESQAADWEKVSEAIAASYTDAILASPSGNASSAKDKRVYFLAPQAEEPLLHQRLADWQQACPTWQLHLSEPLPPYHFI
ncbi:MAG: GvpL/GvpF family gas vesicle protein [Oscillatoria sp. SIO1A7]|nr:GvpL/GvpF family gas vesicle protein [Oscillatoria sp. SIO1A7]